MVMLNMFKKTTPLMLLLLVGCATQKAVFVPVEPSSEKGSALYIYRADSDANLMIPPEVNMRDDQGNKIDIGRLSRGEHKLIFLKPGYYEVQLGEIKYYAPGEELKVEVKPDVVNYLQLTSSLKFETGVHYKAYERKFSVQQVEASVALVELSGSVNIDTKPKKKNKPANAESDAVTKDASQKNEEAVFSTDKMSDPFSRNR